MTTRRAILSTSLAAAASFISVTRPLLGQAATTPPEIYKLAPLPYAADALEPHLDAATMNLHHGKHHQTYVTKLNEALAKLPQKPTGTLDELMGWLKNLDAVPEDIRTAVRNHGGGHYNHLLFWESLAAKPAPLGGDLLKAVEEKFKTADEFYAQLHATGMKVFGSGWSWLCYDPKAKALALTTTPNQDTPLAAGHVPLLGIDVWEHAYYLKYQNKRADYLKAIMNVVNWDVVASRYQAALKA